MDPFLSQRLRESLIFFGQFSPDLLDGPAFTWRSARPASSRLPGCAKDRFCGEKRRLRQSLHRRRRRHPVLVAGRGGADALAELRRAEQALSAFNVHLRPRAGKR